jgi:hypothetical protein
MSLVMVELSRSLFAGLEFPSGGLILAKRLSWRRVARAAGAAAAGNRADRTDPTHPTDPTPAPSRKRMCSRRETSEIEGLGVSVGSLP